MSAIPKTKRKIIEIDEDLCTGCGDCIPSCPEGALRIIDGKARLVGDLLCDGLGACVGHCPTGAMKVIEREAEPYDEQRVMDSIVRQGPATIMAHLRHLKDHGETVYHQQALAYLADHGIPIPENDEAGSTCGGGCPGTAAKEPSARSLGLRNWPVQISLVPVTAPYLSGADLLVAADCAAFAAPGFHEEVAEGRVVLIGCPKLDDAGGYARKLTQIFAENDICSVTVAHMTVPCCHGLVALMQNAIMASGKDLKLRQVVIGLDGAIEEME